MTNNGISIEEYLLNHFDLGIFPQIVATIQAPNDKRSQAVGIIFATERGEVAFHSRPDGSGRFWAARTHPDTAAAIKGVL